MHEVTKKGGRPKKAEDHLKSARIVFWTTPLRAGQIKEKAQAFDLTVSEYCHHYMLDKQITAPFSEQELNLKRGLVGMANNLNQLAYQAHAAGFESVHDSCKELLSELKKELNKYRQ